MNKIKPIVALCWLQAVIAVISMAVSFDVAIRKPVLQFDYNRTSGAVKEIFPGGAASRAGIRSSDRILTVNAAPVRPGVSPLFFARDGDRVPVSFLRDGRTQVVYVTAVSLERARQDALHSGLQWMLWAIASYVNFPLSVWMLGIGVVLLILRPDNSDARLSALSFIYWAGGNFLSDTTGIGAILAPLPPSSRIAVYAIDSFFLAMFFAACVHFALVFPTTGRTSGSSSRYLLAVPYAGAGLIFLESLRQGLARLQPGPSALAPALTPLYLNVGPALLLLALGILAVRLRRTRDLNSRRRLQLVFLALLPGVAGFVVSVAIDHLELGRTAAQVGRMVNLTGTIAASVVFAYAVIRHRMFNIRFLVRRSLQYALARGTLLVLMSLPALALVLFLFSHRADSLSTLLTGTPGVYLLLIIPLLLITRYRRVLLEWLDRRYFREQYDARRMLEQVVSMIREGSDLFGLSRVALDEIERALHPKHLSLWQLSSAGDEYARQFMRGEAEQAPPLDAGGTLPRLLAGDDEPLDLLSRQNRPLRKRLPPEEQEWLAETDPHLLVPLVIEQRLAGILLLGERMSEEPYSREDRELLRTLAAQLALTYDYSRLKGSPSMYWSTVSSRTPVPLADEVSACSVCGACYGPDKIRCEVDSQPLVREIGVPRVIEEKYVVSRLLGRGGMGSVYLATQQRLNRPVAIKVLLGHLVGSTTMRNRFEREARIVARLHHPGIVTIHDFGTLPSGHAYLVMEYLEGQTLRKTILSGPQGAGRTLEIIRPVLEAVEAAHRAGVVHRDLKPENVMLANPREGEALSPRVLDFGLARMNGPLSDQDATLVQSGQSAGIVGTLMYLAPEVLNGKRADERSDQYSLALMAYELITGAHPFGTATDLASIVRGHTQDGIPDIRQRAGGVDEKTAIAIGRALSRQPHDRFESVGAFMSALA